MDNRVTSKMTCNEICEWMSSTMSLTYTFNYKYWLKGYDLDELDYDITDFWFTPNELMLFEQDVYRHILPVDTTGLSYEDYLNIMDLPF